MTQHNHSLNRAPGAQKALSRTHPRSPHRHPGGGSSLYPLGAEGATGAQRGGEPFPPLTAGRGPGPPESPVGEGKCSPHEEKVQHLLRAAKSPVGTQESGEVGGVTAQEGRHQVAHQRLQSASLHAPHPAGLIPVPWGHIFPLGWNEEETRVRGRTKDYRKAGAGAQTEAPSLGNHGKGRARSALHRINVLASRVNWQRATVTCVSVSGQFVLDSSPRVNCVPCGGDQHIPFWG